MDLYIGIDLGTSSVKLMLVDENGSIRNEQTRDYPVYYPNNGWSEQNTSDWWDAICKELSELYASRYEKYRRIYPAVKKLYKEIKE